SSRADRVMLYTYGGRNTVWWKQIHHKLERFKNLTVINLPKDATDQLMPMMKRTMHLQASIQDGQIWLSDEQNTATIVPEVWLNFDN
ncbi:MAG: YaeQ family protein, partial [Methylobacter sp.]|nr:YaeQ family protein [Methylobacter sp.]